MGQVKLGWLAAAACLTLHGQPQPLTFTSSLDGTTQPYILYVPPDLKTSQTYPLAISLHAEDTDYRLHLRQILGPPARHFSPEILVACPFARGDMGYRGIAEQDVYDMLADIERRFGVDPDRVSITGASMGGGAALWLALARPDVWAAAAPISAAVIPGSEELAPNLLDVPIRFYHGEQDPLVPAAAARGWQRRLLDLGVSATYFEYPLIRHNAWDLAYRDGALLDWLVPLRRNRFPDRVRFTTDSYRYSTAYWVRIDGLTPGTFATIDARRSSANAVTVETHNLDGFTLTLDRPISSVSIDGIKIPTRAASTHSFLKAGGRWRLGRYQPAGKRPGAEGPMVAAVAASPIYVYGSLGTHSAGELEARRKVAETAAHWTSPHSRLDFSPLVKVDSEVTATEIDGSDLVLFGNAQTNLLIARFASSLPLALDSGAADYGLLFIAPRGNRYVLVSSGLPWWTGAEAANRGGYSFAPPQYALLSTFGDYILFKGGLDHIVAEGRFGNDWKLPPDAAARLAASGVLQTIR